MEQKTVYVIQKHGTGGFWYDSQSANGRVLSFDSEYRAREELEHVNGYGFGVKFRIVRRDFCDTIVEGDGE